MRSMQNLKLENLLGVWKSDKYTLTILQDKVVLVGNDKNISESVLMERILTMSPNINTIQLSNSINIYLIFNENEINIKISDSIQNNQLTSELFTHLSFIDEFSFYRNIEVPNINKYTAIRWYSPWEYVTLFEICDYSIIKLITGKDEDELKFINDFYNKEGNDRNKWIRVDFHSHFADFRQKDLIEKMQEALMEKQK